MNLRLVTIISIMICICASGVRSGNKYDSDCGNNPAAMLTFLEHSQIDRDRQEILAILDCLQRPIDSLSDDSDLLVDPETYGNLERLSGELRLEVIRVLVPLVKYRDAAIRNRVIAILGYYRYPPARQMLGEYPDGPKKAVLYAILDYGQSYRWAVDQLEKINRTSGFQGEAGQENWRIYMNLLYHLAQPGSLFFVNRIIDSDDPPQMRELAESIKKRILDLHPEVR